MISRCGDLVINLEISGSGDLSGELRIDRQIDLEIFRSPD